MTTVRVGRFLAALAAAALVAASCSSSSSTLPAADESAADEAESPELYEIDETELYSVAGAHYCEGCTPPMIYFGGPVMDTSGPDGVTITPIYWAPAGTEPFPDDYETLINQYIVDIAAASGATDNVYSVIEEFYEEDDAGVKTFLDYKLTAGTPIVSTQAYPADGCTASNSENTACVTDAQLRDELARLALPSSYAHFYPVFFPPKVETQDLDGSNSEAGYCGYHRAFGAAGSEIAYGNEPFVADGCGITHSPNDNYAADGAINVLSHEIIEALTDPGEERAWNDETGHENSDVCADDYDEVLGITNPDFPEDTGYNQLINGNKYFTQTVFSNASFAEHGIGHGCVLGATDADAGPTITPTSVKSVITYAYPNTLPADGTSTADIATTVGDQEGNIVEDDRITFSVNKLLGDGPCGTVTVTNSELDDNGFANAVYTASTADVACAIVATDAIAGQSSKGTVYQGTTQGAAPVAAHTFPSNIEPGAAPVTFTASFRNPTDAEIVNSRGEFVIFAAEGATTDLKAEDVTLEVSLTGAEPFTPVELIGATLSEGEIQGLLDEEGGFDVGVGETRVYTFRMSVAASVPTDTIENAQALTAAPQAEFEVYLNQVNHGTGAISNLADTEGSEFTLAAAQVAATTTVESVDELPSTGSSNQTGTIVAVAIGFLLLGGLLVLRVRRARVV